MHKERTNAFFNVVVWFIAAKLQHHTRVNVHMKLSKRTRVDRAMHSNINLNPILRAALNAGKRRWIYCLIITKRLLSWNI